MPPDRRAVIDVGTNSVKVLVAEVRHGQIHPLEEQSLQTRLGQGFFGDHRLRPEAIKRTAEAVSTFATIARNHGAATPRVIATSAARDAVNAGELVQALEQAAGCAVEVISGEREADWACRGVLTDERLRGESLLIMDLGGGSTEFILAESQQARISHSFRLGTVRLLERFPHADPPQPAELAHCREFARDFLRREVRPIFLPGATVPSSTAPHLLVGTGGTAAILGRMEARLEDFDREQIEAQVLSLARVRWHTEHLWRQTLAERQTVPGLPPNRADVILAGVVIYEAVMEELSLDRLRISTRGLRWAALLADR